MPLNWRESRLPFDVKKENEQVFVPVHMPVLIIHLVKYIDSFFFKKKRWLLRVHK